MPEPFDDVLEPEKDPGLHRDRRVHGGMPERLDDDALERAVEEDRVAAGVSDYAPADVPRGDRSAAGGHLGGGRPGRTGSGRRHHRRVAAPGRGTAALGQPAAS